MKSHLRPQTLAIIALACGLAASALAWFAAGHQVEREGQAKFDAQAGLAAGLLERRIQRYIDLLYSVAALAYHDETLNRAEFARFIASLSLDRRYRGVQAVEFIRRVSDEERDGYVQSVRADRSLFPEGQPGFDIRPGGRRAEYWVVDFVEPRAGNESLPGLDMRTRVGAAATAERAHASNEPAATGRYRLSPDTGSSYGVMIYLPVFQAPPSAASDPHARPLRGFVDVALRVDDTFSDVLAEPLVGGLRLQIRDLGILGGSAGAGAQDTVFYRSPEPAAPASAFPWAEWHHTTEHALAVGGRSWQLEFESPPELNPWLTRFPLFILGAGLGMTFLIYAALSTVARARSAALGVADRATAELRRQLSFTQQLIEAMPNPVFFKDAEGRYLGCNRAFEDSIGLPREMLMGKTVEDIAAPDFADLSMRADKALLEKSGEQTYETTLTYARDGSKRDVLVNKATFYSPSGEVAGLVGVLVDITAMKHLEAQTRESHERLRAVIHAAPLAIVARDLDGVIRMWNPAAERMFGWKEADILETGTSIAPARLRGEALELRRRAQSGETLWIEETRRMHRDGREIDVAMSVAPIYGAEGMVIGTMATLADISRRKIAEQALRESEEQLRLAMEAAQMGTWYWECETDRFLHSEGLTVLFGGKATDPASHYRVFQERLHPEDRELLRATIRHVVRRGADFQMDYRVVWPDGSVHWVTNRGQIHRGPDGRAKRVIGVAMDITDRKLAEQRIAHMAHHDALTGLPNRVLLRDRIQQAIAQAHRNTKELAVLFLDLDRFKTINDSLGHQLGDRLLQSVASRILVCVREGDTVARVGGDEFVIVIPGIASSVDASSVAAKILEVLASAFHLNGNDLHVSASIGISLYPADGADAETLMRNADTAMYHAKDTGRGNFQFFTQHMNVAAQQRLTLETALRRAVEGSEFELQYQPLFDLRDRSITGFEALVRWNAPGGEVVPPAQFIAAAEDSGLIVPIGEWVLREALLQAKTWQGTGRPITVAVNVSANQLARTSFVERLRALLEETRVDPALLELEVTESVIIEGAGEARAALDQIAALGVGIAIDDFGTGYSGLAYLKRLPIDTVKIDQSFVRDLTVDPDDAAIVTAIVAMAASLGVEVVAEGVETEEQLAQLRRLGCQRAQGFLLARPMSAAAAARLVSRAPVEAEEAE